MPVYTYRCDACGFTFDKRLGFNDTPPTRCPECGAEALYRVYKPVGIVFKGSGFYATDHRSPSGTQNHDKSNDNGKGKSAAASADKTPAKSQASTSSPPPAQGAKAPQAAAKS